MQSWSPQLRAQARRLLIATECDDSCPAVPNPTEVYECGGWQEFYSKIVVDCTLEEWTPWIPCSVACGAGFQNRAKHVLIPTRGFGKCPKEDGPERAAEQECNQQDCAGDEICVAQQDLIIAVDGSGSVQEGGFNTMKNYALNLFEKYHSQFRP